MPSGTESAGLRGVCQTHNPGAFSFGGAIVNSLETIPAQAQCLSCGYLLRGLPEPVCPECARAFDPADPSTFDADPRKRRRRRLLVRGAAVLAILAVGVVFLPRGILKADITFTCSQCNRKITVTRWQLNTPSWISFPYLGFSSRNDSTTDPVMPSLGHCDHWYTFVIRLGMSSGKWTKVYGSLRPGQTWSVNGVSLSLDTASQVLRTMMAPGSKSLNSGPSPVATSGSR